MDGVALRMGWKAVSSRWVAKERSSMRRFAQWVSSAGRQRVCRAVEWRRERRWRFEVGFMRVFRANWSRVGEAVDVRVRCMSRSCCENRVCSRVQVVANGMAAWI